MASKVNTVNDVIRLIKTTSEKDFEIDYDRDKNYETIFEYNLSHEDIVDILKSLSLKNFDKTEKCDDKFYEVDMWYRFKIFLNLRSYDGIVDGVGLFIRIGIKPNIIKIIVRSFHKDD